MCKVNVEYDLTPAMVEGAIRNKLIEMGWTPPEPKQKVIKLDEMAGSDIDMEFSNFKFKGHIFIGKLSRYDGMYSDANDEYDFCRIRQDHWHFWAGGTECPLPEGLEVEFITKTDGYERTTKYHKNTFAWHCMRAFKVLGTADDGRYEWEKEE